MITSARRALPKPKDICGYYPRSALVAFLMTLVSPDLAGSAFSLPPANSIMIILSRCRSGRCRVTRNGLRYHGDLLMHMK